MAVRERSIGPIYSARVPLGVDWCPPHTGGIVQMSAPWRQGRAVLVPIWKRQAFAIGIWTKTRANLPEDLADAQWLNPHWMDDDVSEIAQWGVNAEEKTETGGEVL